MIGAVCHSVSKILFCLKEKYVYLTLFCFVFSHHFQIVPRAHGNVLKSISVHTRLQETPETL